MTVTLAPMFGWIVSPILALILVCLAVFTAAQYRRTAVPRSGMTDTTVWAVVRRVLMCLLLAIIILTPARYVRSTTQAVNATDVYIAVDTTGSMAVNDAHYKGGQAVTRLNAASRAVKDIARMYPDASFSVIRFGASTSTDLPLTPDSNAVTQWADTLATEATATSRGSNLDAPLDSLIASMANTKKAHPGDTVVLYYISDGESTGSQARRTFSALRKYVDNAVVIGVGSAEGGKVPLTQVGVKAMDTQDNAGQWGKDPATGEDGISKLDEASLKSIADELSGTYIHITQERGIPLQDSAGASRDYRLRTVTRRADYTVPVIWPFTAIFALIFAWELAAWTITSRRML